MKNDAVFSISYWILASSVKILSTSNSSDFTLLEPREPLKHSNADFRSAKDTFARVHDTVVSLFRSNKLRMPTMGLFPFDRHSTHRAKWLECDLLYLKRFECFS